MAICKLDNNTPILQFLYDVPSKDIGDIGGGTGKLAHELFKLGHRVTVIDPCRSMTKIAQHLEPRLKIVNQPLSALDNQSKFDCLILRDCLHHLKNQQEALIKCSTLLKKDGVVIVQDFVPDYLVSKCIFAFERFCFEQVTPISPETLKLFCQKADLCAEYHLLNKRDYLLIARKVDYHDDFKQN